jgi:hypothetical protein
MTLYEGKGLGAIKEANKNSTSMLTLKDGESTVIRIIQPLDELVSVYEHTEKINGRWVNVRCLGKETCPLCKAGKYASFRTYIPVFDKKDERVKIFKASKTVGVQLVGLAEEYGDLTKRDFKVLRQGEGLKTTYQFFPRDPEEFDVSELELPNIDALIEPVSIEEIEALINQKVSDVEPTNPAVNDANFPF